MLQRHLAAVCIALAALLCFPNGAHADQAALANVVLKSGTSLEIANDRMTAYNLAVDLGRSGSLDYAYYDGIGSFGACDSCGHGTTTQSGSRVVPARARLVVTNSGTSDVILSAPSELFQAVGRTQPALRRALLEPGRSLTVVNQTQLKYFFRTEIGPEGKLEYAFYDGDGNYRNHGRQTASGLMEMGALSQVTLTNVGNGNVTLIGPGELFQVEESQTPAVGSGFIRRGKSILVSNRTESSYPVQVEIPTGGQLDYAYYDDQGLALTAPLFRHGQLTGATDLAIPVHGQVVLTNTGTGDVTLRAPYAVFTGAETRDLALVYTEVAPWTKHSVPNFSGGEFYVSISGPAGMQFGYMYSDMRGKADSGLGTGQATTSQMLRVPKNRVAEIANLGPVAITVSAPSAGVYPGGPVPVSPVTLDTPAKRRPKLTGADVKVSNIKGSTAVLEWTSDVPSDFTVTLSGRTEPLAEGEREKAQRIDLKGLRLGETYTVELRLKAEQDEIRFVVVFTSKTSDD